MTNDEIEQALKESKKAREQKIRAIKKIPSDKAVKQKVDGFFIDLKSGKIYTARITFSQGWAGPVVPSVQFKVDRKWTRRIPSSNYWILPKVSEFFLTERGCRLHRAAKLIRSARSFKKRLDKVQAELETLRKKL
jgi:hypothetical protein